MVSVHDAPRTPVLFKSHEIREIPLLISVAHHTPWITDLHMRPSRADENRRYYGTQISQAQQVHLVANACHALLAATTALPAQTGTGHRKLPRRSPGQWQNQYWEGARSRRPRADPGVVVYLLRYPGRQLRALQVRQIFPQSEEVLLRRGSHEHSCVFR